MSLKNDLLYYRRSYALSKIKLEQVEDSKGRKRASTSINSERIADTTRQFLQGNVEYVDFKYDRLSKMAEEELKNDFERLGLNHPKNERERQSFQKKKRIAISNWQEKYIEENFPRKLRIDFDDFIRATNIQKAQHSVKKALDILIAAQNSNFYEIEHLQLDLETGKVETGISRISALPAITLWLDESVSGEGYTLESFAEADIKNKRELIRGLEIEFSPKYLFHVLSIGNDYVTSHKSKREKLSHAASYKFDILISSLQFSKNKKTITFDIEDLKNQLGVSSDIEYKYFKRNTINKIITDINEKMNKKVELKEHRTGRKVTSVSFIIEEDSENPLLDFIFHYISSQLFYFSKYNIKNIEQFSSYLKNKEIPDEEEIGDKIFAEWKDEAEKAFTCENDILNMLEADALFFKRNNLIYDKKKHTIMREISYTEDGEDKKKYHLIKTETTTIKNPIESLRYINQLEREEIKNSVHVIDLIPFGYFDYGKRKWVKIDTADKVVQYKEKIYKDIAIKKTESFTFDDSTKQDIFIYYVEKNMFNEISEGYLKKIQKIFDFD